MMRAAWVALAGLLLAASLTGGPAAGEARQQPFELVRSLRRLQDDIARGSAAAQAMQRTLVRDIGEQLLRADAGVWQDPRNARAAVIYVLSGGSPAVLEELIARGRLAVLDQKLAKGALAYGRGRNGEASELLSGIDARSQGAVLGGQLALVQALLVAKSDPKRAMVRLDDARLLAPGTLIEEAALRRQTFLAAAAGQRDRFVFLSAQYLRRFSGSAYAASFRRQFAAEVISRATGSDPIRLPALESALRELPARERRDLYLGIAREGALKGLVEVASFAAAEACRAECATPAEVEQARLYESAVLIVTDRFEAGLAALRQVERAVLSAEDAELLDAALLVAREVRRPITAADAAGEPPEDSGRRPDRGPPVKLKGADLARTAIARADKLLEEAR